MILLTICIGGITFAAIERILAIVHSTQSKSTTSIETDQALPACQSTEIILSSTNATKSAVTTKKINPTHAETTFLSKTTCKTANTIKSIIPVRVQQHLPELIVQQKTIHGVVLVSDNNWTPRTMNMLQPFTKQYPITAEINENAGNLMTTVQVYPPTPVQQGVFPNAEWISMPTCVISIISPKTKDNLHDSNVKPNFSSSPKIHWRFPLPIGTVRAHEPPSGREIIKL